MIYDLYIALCAHHPSVTIYLAPFTLYDPSTTPPRRFGNHHTVICVYELQFYILHVSKVIWFLDFSD